MVLLIPVSSLAVGPLGGGSLDEQWVWSEGVYIDEERCCAPLLGFRGWCLKACALALLFEHKTLRREDFNMLTGFWIYSILIHDNTTQSRLHIQTSVPAYNAYNGVITLLLNEDLVLLDNLNFLWLLRELGQGSAGDSDLCPWDAGVELSLVGVCSLTQCVCVEGRCSSASSEIPHPAGRTP